MNKTIPSYEAPVTERELNALIQPPVSTGGCCSSQKPKENANKSHPAEAKSSCCCH